MPAAPSLISGQGGVPWSLENAARRETPQASEFILFGGYKDKRFGGSIGGYQDTRITCSFLVFGALVRLGFGFASLDAT